MEAKMNEQGRGWHGDAVGHAKAGRKGGQTTANRYGREFYEEIGRSGGQSSTGKFKKGSQRAKEAGHRGGIAKLHK